MESELYQHKSGWRWACKEGFAGVQVRNDGVNHSGGSGFEKNCTNKKTCKCLWIWFEFLIFYRLLSTMLLFCPLVPWTKSLIFWSALVLEKHSSVRLKFQIPNQTQTSSVPLLPTLTRLWIWSGNDVWSCLSYSSHFSTSFKVEVVSLVWLVRG